MKLVKTLVIGSVLALAPAAFAQKWEFGGGVGGGFYTSQDVTNAGGSASAKLQNGITGAAWLGNNGQGHWSGELRYEYGMSDLELKSGGTTATFSGHTHQVHYDVMWHATPSEARVRPFVAAGAGIKLFEGTGKEAVFQPLSNFALLSKEQDLTALVSVGAGIKFQLSPHVQIRLDVHDYLSPFPKKTIMPNAGSKVGGWLQDFVPMVGISYTN